MGRAEGRCAEMTDIFNKRLKELVALSGMTQIDFGASVNRERKTINRWVNGHAVPNINELIRICKIHKVSADWLLGLDKDDAA